MSAKPCACISLMSAPAANAFSLPVSTAQPWLASASNAANACDQFAQHLAVERVQRLRAVERDERHRAALLDQDGFVIGHRVSSFRRERRPRLVGGQRLRRWRRSSSSVTPSGVAGFQRGRIVLVDSSARTPSTKSWRCTTCARDAHIPAASRRRNRHAARPRASRRSDDLHAAATWSRSVASAASAPIRRHPLRARRGCPRARRRRTAGRSSARCASDRRAGGGATRAASRIASIALRVGGDPRLDLVERVGWRRNAWRARARGTPRRRAARRSARDTAPIRPGSRDRYQPPPTSGNRPIAVSGMANMRVLGRDAVAARAARCRRRRPS